MSKKKESKMESPIKVTDYLNEKVERLTKHFEYLNKLHDDNCERGNKTFKEIAIRLDTLEKEKNESHNSNKPKVGEIWKIDGGNNFLIKFEYNTGRKFYEGLFIDINQCWFKIPSLRKGREDMIFSVDDLIEKIC